MKHLFHLFLIVMILLSSASGSISQDKTAKATFAGGCFWSVEAAFEPLDGVVSATSGFMGDKDQPANQQVSESSASHVEAVEIVYDPNKISYEKLLEVYWENIDPTDPNGQFCDRGPQYRTVIFYHDQQQKSLAEKSEAEVETILHQKVVTAIFPAATFIVAEESHQDFTKKKKLQYMQYKKGCGRDRRLREVWERIRIRNANNFEVSLMISSIGSNGLFLRSLVVDGDPISRRALIDLLSTNPVTRLVKACSNGMDAMAAIREWKPDVLLCEVETPGIDCFAILETMTAKERPAVIFISRTDRYAARAFDVAAADYLVKPIRQDRLWKALERAKRQIESKKISTVSSTTDRNGRQLVIRSGRSATFIRSDEVDWAEAEGKYVRLHMGKEFLILKIGISALEAKLDPDQFVRIHRSTLINVDRVRQVQPWNNRRTYQVTLQDGTQLVLSRKSKLLEMSTKTIASTTENSYRNNLNTGIL